MLDFFVVRGDGLNRGIDILDPLMSTVEVVRSRGQNELDAQGGIREVTIRAVFKPNVRIKDLVRVHDSFQARTWVGKVSAIKKTVSTAGAFMDLVLKRPTLGTIID